MDALKPIEANGYSVEFSQKAFGVLESFLKVKKYSSIFILVDINTKGFCLKYFLDKIESGIEFKIIEIDPGEEKKDLTTCDFIWRNLSKNGADRKSLLINLGGGVISDLGGFVAATYMRGMDFVNVPTTLLSMVDASIGGKTGIDLDNLKNQIGVIANPCLVLIDYNFLKTLSQSQFRSGYAEMLKHGLIKNEKYFKELIDYGFSLDHLIQKYVYKSVVIKNEVVKKDLKELGERKLLNFGHTLGHAIESYFLTQKKGRYFLHGEAVAAGIILESFLSMKLSGLSLNDTNYISNSINKFFPKIKFSKSDILSIIDLVRYDKKNVGGKNRFTLLTRIGEATIDNEVSVKLIKLAFEYYEFS